MAIVQDSHSIVLQRCNDKPGPAPAQRMHQMSNLLLLILLPSLQHPKPAAGCNQLLCPTCAWCPAVEDDIKLLVLWQRQHAPNLLLKLLCTIISRLNLHLVRFAVE
jgi:hypothetical protein